MASGDEVGDQRRRVLVAVDRLTDGGRLDPTFAADVAVETGLDERRVSSAVGWLVEQGFLSFQSSADPFTVTPSGSSEAERIVAHGVDPALA